MNAHLIAFAFAFFFPKTKKVSLGDLNVFIGGSNYMEKVGSLLHVSQFVALNAPEP
jgi:hypothetical protein